MSAAELLREVASALEALGPGATEADICAAIVPTLQNAERKTVGAVLGVLVGSLDRLRAYPTVAQGAAELRKLADEIDPVVEVEIVTIPDGCYALGDPPPEGPPFSTETGGPYLA